MVDVVNSHLIDQVVAAFHGLMAAIRGELGIPNGTGVDQLGEHEARGRDPVRRPTADQKVIPVVPI